MNLDTAIRLQYYISWFRRLFTNLWVFWQLKYGCWLTVVAVDFDARQMNTFPNFWNDLWWPMMQATQRYFEGLPGIDFEFVEPVINELSLIKIQEIGGYIAYIPNFAGAIGGTKRDLLTQQVCMKPVDLRPGLVSSFSDWNHSLVKTSCWMMRVASKLTNWISWYLKLIVCLAWLTWPAWHLYAHPIAAYDGRSCSSQDTLLLWCQFCFFLFILAWFWLPNLRLFSRLTLSFFWWRIEILSELGITDAHLLAKLLLPS